MVSISKNVKPPKILSPKRIIPDSEWSQPKWSNDKQPYFARATFMKLCLPAVLYSIVINSAFKILSLVPFTSQLGINIQKLHPKDCFVLPSPTSKDEYESSVAIVTGSNTGVGLETASGLAERGYHVILACRSREKGKNAADKINAHIESMKSKEDGTQPEHFVEGGNALFLHPLDLSSFASVRSFCKVFCNKYNTLNILVNNAGINSQGDITEDGLEICFQSNFVGHFLLTKLLLRHLLKARNSYQIGSNRKEEAGRVVNLSSVTHHFAPANERTLAYSIDKDLPLNNGIHDQHFWLGCATPSASNGTYRESKLASILFSMELNKRYPSIRSVSVNPGSVSSDIWRDESSFMQRAYKMIYLTPKQGCSTSLAGSLGCLPENAIYLQPYFQWRSKKQSKSTTHRSFNRWYSLPFPMFEMLGPYVGYAVTEPRLPLNDGNRGYESSNALWSVCERITSFEEE